MKPPTPPEEIAQLMRFIAEKTKNVKSPMNTKRLAAQFIDEHESRVSVAGIKKRLYEYRNSIQDMNEFDMKTRVKMMFALSAPIDAGFLIEMKKVADVEVDDQQRIIQYKQKDGELKLSAKYRKISMKQGEQRNKDMIQFLVEKSKTTDKPISDRVLLREFKEKSGCNDSLKAIEHRYQRVKKTIYQSSGIDENTKIKMMFISNAQLPGDVLEELRKDADVEVDDKQRIYKYKANDGSLKLEGSHGKSSIEAKRNTRRRGQKICQKEEDDDDETVERSDGSAEEEEETPKKKRARKG